LIESHDNRSARKRIEEKGVTLVSNNIEGKVVIINNVLYGIAAALPHMQKQKSGHIEF
jgi:NADP-dependent 3-hydroxy acid dehydrogenase YdfG